MATTVEDTKVLKAMGTLGLREKYSQGDLAATIGLSEREVARACRSLIQHELVDPAKFPWLENPGP